MLSFFASVLFMVHASHPYKAVGNTTVSRTLTDLAFINASDVNSLITLRTIFNE